MAQTVADALAQTKLFTDGQSYNVIRLPASAIAEAANVVAETERRFGVLIADKDEVTLVVPVDAWGRLASRIPGAEVSPKRYRLITFDVILDFALVGFMARVSQALAEAGVSILPYAAFTRDHVLVPEEQFPAAWAALEQLKSAR